MSHTLSPRRIEAAERCYRELDRDARFQEHYDTAEHAILLVLSSGRPEKDARYLAGDALRDARHHIRRSGARSLRVVQEAGRLAEAGVGTGATQALADDDGPEPQALAAELRELLWDYAYAVGAPLPRVLGGLLVGETGAETAKAAHISRSSVTRARRALRQHAIDCGYEPLAA